MAKSFNKYKIKPNTDKPQMLADPILSFFNGGFLMPAKQGGILAYPNNNNQSGYVAPRMDVGGFNTTTQTTFPPFMGPIILPGNPLMNLVTKAVGYFTGDDKKPAPTPAQQKIMYDQMRDLYSNADRTFYRDHPYMDKVPYSGKTIKLTKGRLTGADIDTGLLDFIKKTAAKNNMDPYKLAALISRESTFGVGTGSDRAGSLQSLASGWNVDQDYVPYQLDRFLADRQVPGIKTVKDKRGWRFFVDDQTKVNDYLKNHPQLLQQYQKKLAGVKALDKNATYFDLAGQWINKPGGVRKYNPGASGYENLYNQDLNLLRSDPAFSKYFGSKEAGGAVGVYGYRNYDNDILSNKAKGGDISIPDLNTPNWLMKYEPGGPISPKDFTLQYINSPKYRERLTKGGYENINAEIKRRYDNVKNTNNIITQSGPSGIWDSFKGFVFNEPYNPTGGSNASSKHTIFYDPTEAKKIGSTKDETLSHEFSHKETMGDDDGTIFLNNRDIKELTGRLNPGAKKMMHDARADENKADMNAVRYWLYNNGVDVFNKDLTLEDLNKAKASGKFTSNRLFKNYKSDDDVLWLLNNVAKNESSSKNMDMAAYGLEVDNDKPKKKTSFKESVEKGKQFNIDWMNSPMYKKMLEASTNSKMSPNTFLEYQVDTPAKVMDQNRKYQINNAQWGIGERDPRNPETTAAEAYSWRPWRVPQQGTPINYNTYIDPGAKYPNSIPYVNFVQGVAGQRGDDLSSDAVHEFSHISDSSGQLIPKKDIDLMNKYSDKSARYAELERKYGKKFADSERKADDNKWFNYLKDPTETRARLNDFRMRAKEQGLYDPFTQKFDIKYLKNYKIMPSGTNGSFDPLDQLRGIYTDEEISDMLNKISKSESTNEAASNTAQYGGWLDKFDEGGWLDDYTEYAKGGELPIAKVGAVTNAPCPPGPKGEQMIRVDGVCVPYSSLKTSVFLSNNQGDYSSKWTKLAGASTAPGSTLPGVVGPGVTYPTYLKDAYVKSGLKGMTEEKGQMVYQNGKWVKASDVQTPDQLLAKHFTKKQQSAVDKYWNEQMADPDVKAFVMNDPVAYQSLRLEAYKSAKVDKYTLKTKACAAGFGYVWDDEKQTCVPISTKHKVNKQGAYRSLNPMYYREALSGIIGKSGSLTGQDANIEKVLPSSGVTFDRTYGKNKLPIYTDAMANTSSTVMPNQQLAHVFDDPTGKLKFRDVAHTDTKSVEDLNNVLTQEKQQDYIADETLQGTLNNIHKNGLRATGVGGDWLIKPGEFGSANNPYLKEAVKRWTVNSPGYFNGADWKLHSGNLDKLYNQGSWMNRAINTLSMGSNMAESEGYGKTGYKVPDFFRNVALGTANDVATGLRLGRGFYNKTIGNPNDAVYDQTGVSIDSPTGIMDENAEFNKSQIGLLGAGNIPNLYFATKDLAKSGNDFWKDPSLSRAGNLGLNTINVPFQAWLSTPVFGGFGKAGVKTAEKEGVNVFSKGYLKDVSRQGLQGAKKTVGDIIGKYEGKTLPQQIKTAAGTPARLVTRGYWGPATQLTQFPLKPFGETIAKSPFGFKAGTEVWQNATGTNPFKFMWDPIPDKFYDPSAEGQNYNIKTTPAQTQQPSAPAMPKAYQVASDTIYNVKIGDKIYPIDTRTKDGKELFNVLPKFDVSHYDLNTHSFNLPIKDDKQKSILQNILGQFTTPIKNK